MNTIRSFIAINILTKIRSRLERIQHDLKKSNTGLQLVKLRNIHITLKFLGDVPIENIGVIQDAIGKSILQVEAFPISFSKIGGFPNLQYPRVIWVGIEKGVKEICLMESMLKPQGAQYNTLKTFLLE